MNQMMRILKMWNKINFFVISVGFLILMDRIFSAEQIQVPSEFPPILKAYTKEVIRYQPKDIVAFSRDYFAALAGGDVEHFLKEYEQKQIKEREQS